MMGLRLILAVSALSLGLIGSASSHTKPKHEPVTHEPVPHGHVYRPHSSHAPARRAYHSYSHGHTYSYGHSATRPRYPTRHPYHHTYHRPPPPPPPGRRPDGRYVLPGGLESVCAGGTPPPCQ